MATSDRDMPILTKDCNCKYCGNRMKVGQEFQWVSSSSYIVKASTGLQRKAKHVPAHIKGQCTASYEMICEAEMLNDIEGRFRK